MNWSQQVLLTFDSSECAHSRYVGQLYFYTWIYWRYRPSGVCSDEENGREYIKMFVLKQAKNILSSKAVQYTHRARLQFEHIIKTTLRFGPLILVQLVLCKSHMVLQVSKIGPFLLPFSWSLPLEFSDRTLSFSFEKLLILSQNRERTEEKEKILSLLIAPLISFDFLGDRTAPCLTDIQKRRSVI